MRKSLIFLTIFCFIFVFTGCSVTFQKRHRSDIENIQKLKSEIQMLGEEMSELEKAKAREVEELRRAKAELEKRLKKEIGEESIRLDLEERGLVITFLAEVLFDSGKAELKRDSLGILDKISHVFKKDIPNKEIAVEGHTDNEPIKYSGWKSNWELSTARATSVLHYLVDKKGVTPKLVKAVGYGEFRPVASNDTPEGRQLNRRVELIVHPKHLKPEDLPKTEEKRGSKYKK